MTGTPQPPQQVPQQPVYQAPQQPMYQAPQQPPTPGKGLQVAGMVMGIVSLGVFLVPFLNLACAIVGLILSTIGIKKASTVPGTGKGMGIAGLVCSIIGLVWGVIHVIIFFVVVSDAARRVRRIRQYRYCIPPLRHLLRL